MLQALVAPVLPVEALATDGVVRQFLERTDIEPGLALASRLHKEKITLRTIGIRSSELPRQVVHVFRRLGLVRRFGRQLDVIGDILGARYQASGTGEWLRLLGSEYVHAAGILVQAEATFWTGRSHWLSQQNSFNQVIFLALREHLNRTGRPGVVTTRTHTGELVDYGVTLDKNNAFSRAYPAIADVFRAMNARRNRLPCSHPYEKKSAAQTRYLSAQERNRFVRQLQTGYAEVLRLM